MDKIIITICGRSESENEGNMKRIRIARAATNTRVRIMTRATRERGNRDELFSCISY